jgi:CDP-paratose 2-epimerase
MRVLVTGGAGFVGGNLVVALARRHPAWEIAALDNLSRRGSELNLPRLEEAGVEFFDGDVREPGDLRAAGDFTAIVECSAEPSVLAALDDPLRCGVRSSCAGRRSRRGPPA